MVFNAIALTTWCQLSLQAWSLHAISHQMWTQHFFTALPNLRNQKFKSNKLAKSEPRYEDKNRKPLTNPELTYKLLSCNSSLSHRANRCLSLNKGNWMAILDGVLRSPYPISPTCNSFINLFPSPQIYSRNVWTSLEIKSPNKIINSLKLISTHYSNIKCLNK